MYNYWYLGACKLTLIGLKLQCVLSVPPVAPNGINNDRLTALKPCFLNFPSVLHCSAKQEVPFKTRLPSVEPEVGKFLLRKTTCNWLC